MPPAPNPYDRLVCTDGVAESIATIDKTVRTEWDAVKAAHGPETPICAQYARALALGTAGAAQCIYRDMCAMRRTEPPRLAP